MTGGVNQTATVTESNSAGHLDIRTFNPGCYNLTVTGTAKDDDGGMSAALPIYSNSATSVYGNGFRPPIMDNERHREVRQCRAREGRADQHVHRRDGDERSALRHDSSRPSGGETIEDTPVVVAESVSAADNGS